MVAANELDQVGQAVGAYLLRLEQVHILVIFGHKEVPCAVDILAKAVHRLIGLARAKQ